MKNICIIGAGAIGGFIGTRLAASGQEGVRVSAIARGATLDALRTHGWRLHQGDALLQAPVAAASEHAADLGIQDLVILAVKGPALAQVARQISPLLGPETVVLPAMNGVPWWFIEGQTALGDAPLDSVDPGGTIREAIPLYRVLGCVVHASTASPEPGLVQHRMGQGLVVGEPLGGHSERSARVTELLVAAGFDVTHSADVRADIWYKLWGNLTMNPISALTGATIDRVLADPLTRQFCTDAMAEAAQIGERIGCHIAQRPEDRHLITARLGAFKTSMLQDVEAGRPIELDAIVTAVREIGRRVQLPTPQIDVLLGLTRLFARGRGLYPEDSGMA
jgi:2-dehydropantoate 2-reductase